MKAGLNLGDVDQFPNIDVTIDGADEVDVSSNLLLSFLFQAAGRSDFVSEER